MAHCIIDRFCVITSQSPRSGSAPHPSQCYRHPRCPSGIASHDIRESPPSPRSSRQAKRSESCQSYPRAPRDKGRSPFSRSRCTSRTGRPSVLLDRPQASISGDLHAATPFVGISSKTAWIFALFRSNLAFTSAPLDTNNRTVSSKPFSTACCSGVWPFSDLSANNEK